MITAAREGAAGVVFVLDPAFDADAMAAVAAQLAAAVSMTGAGMLTASVSLWISRHWPAFAKVWTCSGAVQSGFCQLVTCATQVTPLAGPQLQGQVYASGLQLPVAFVQCGIRFSHATVPGSRRWSARRRTAG